jgi:ferrous iron transport protein B
MDLPVLASLIEDGVVAGVGSVLVFLPFIALFFLLYALLEDVGYMARAAFVMDRAMHAVGLHGRTFLCLLMGFGCNIPGIMCARTMRERKDRLIAILVNPLVPCGARLGVLVFITAIFFKGAAATGVMISLIALSLALVAVVSILFRKFLLPGEHPAFMMEMPPYHRPVLRGLVIHTWERLRVFVKRVGTVIVAFSVVVWAVSHFPIGTGFENSYAAQLGVALEPIGSLMGFNWPVMVALLFGFVAKELVVSTLGVLYGAEEEVLSTTLAQTWTPLTAYTFLAVSMIYVPCLAALASVWKESASWRWAAFAAAYSLALAFLVGATIYHLGLYAGYDI